MPAERKRTPGRPRGFDRDQALAIALELFWRQGFEGTSTAQLTQAMGITPPSLYAAFGSKEALYREAVDRYLATYGEFLTRALSGPTSAREAVAKLLQDAAQQFSQAEHPHGCMVSYAVLQCAPENAALATEMTGHRQAARTAIKTRLDRARATGELPPDADTNALAAFYAALLQGMAVQAKDGASPALLQQIAQLALQAWPCPSNATSQPQGIATKKTTKKRHSS